MCRALGVAPTHLRAESSPLVPVTGSGPVPTPGQQKGGSRSPKPHLGGWEGLLQIPKVLTNFPEAEFSAGEVGDREIS